MVPRFAVLAAALLLAAPALAPAHESVSADVGLERLAGETISPITAALGAKAKAAKLADDAPGTLTQLGHTPLGFRGMNSALAVHKTGGKVVAYVGSRIDGTQAGAGVAVVDVTNPAAPAQVRVIRTPALGESSRELRVIPHQDLLLVLNHGCSELIHRCANGSQAGRNLPPSTIEVYDVAGANALAPKLLSTYRPSRQAAQTPHEFFVWTDPRDEDRILVYGTTPGGGTTNQILVADFSRAREGVFPETATFRLGQNLPLDDRLHSFTVSHDGTRAYFAYLGGGFMVADTSDFAEGRPQPQVRLVTPPENRVAWSDPGAHSAIKLPGRDVVMTTDEVYGKLGGVLPAHGCPWGWPRFIDIADETKPRLLSEYRLPVNEQKSCEGVDEVRNNLSSFASHNPTLTKNLALLTWHSAGLQVIDTSDPEQPKAAAQFLPEPLPAVQVEDPALSSGYDKVVMWSFPVIVDGLIYVVDLRNGLYVLKYEGKHQKEVERTTYLDGNSNSGDVGKLEAAS
jgi:hypothetical protein